MVAPNYAKTRSELARGIGLGRKRAEAAPEPGPEMVEAASAETTKKRGRSKKAE